MPPQFPEFQAAYVISDLHLGGESGRQIFESGTAFEQFIEYLLRATRDAVRSDSEYRVLLVINGDFVDFLAEPGARVFNHHDSARMLETILSRPEFAPVTKGLQDFVAARGTHLVITLGNHDVELALPDTRRTLLRLLTDGTPDREGRIEFSFDGWGYRFQVGGKKGVCLHGNEADAYNFTRYDELDRIAHDLMFFDRSDFAEGWCPSAGSRFVIDAINPIKHRFPFVDLLKPEFPLAVTVLAVLDPRNIVFADEAARMKAASVTNTALQPASQRRMLSAAAAEAESPRLVVGSASRGIGLNEADYEESVENDLLRGRIDERIYRSAETAMLGFDLIAPLRRAAASLRDAAVDLTRTTADALTGAARAAHWRTLRQTIRPLVTDQPQDLTALDESDRLIDATVGGAYDVMFSGHTHMRRLLKRASGPVYVNTGTWAGLMSLTRSQVDSADFERIYDALRSGRRDDLRDPGLKLVRDECTVARLYTGQGGAPVVELGRVTSKTDFEVVAAERP